MVEFSQKNKKVLAIQDDKQGKSNLDELGLQVQVVGDYGFYKEQFKQIDQQLPALSNFVEGTEAHKYIKSFYEQYFLLKQKAQQLDESVLNFKNGANEIYNELEEISAKITRLINNKDLKCSTKLFDTNLELVKKKTTRLLEKFNDFQKEFFSTEEDAKFRDTIQKGKSIIPKDCSQIIEDLALAKFDIQERRFQLIQKYQKALDTEYMKILRLKFDAKVEEKQAEVSESKIDDLKNQIELYKQYKTTLEDATNDQESNLTEVLNELDRKNIQAQVESNARYNQDLKTMQESINSASLQIQEVIKKLGSIDIVESLFHFIFVLDESSSMSSYFNDLKAAFKSFIDFQKGKSSKHDVSVVLFESKARVTHLAQNIMENMQIDPKGGGTNFSDAFKQAAYCFGQTKSNYLPVIIFMTDGEGSTTESEAYLKDMFKQNNKLLTFTIGFGRDCNQSSLEKICLAGNGGHKTKIIESTPIGMVYQSDSGKELISVFTKIAKCFNTQLANTEAKLNVFKEQRDQAQLNMTKQIKQSQQETSEQIKQQNENSRLEKLYIEQNQSNLKMKAKMAQDEYDKQIASFEEQIKVHTQMKTDSEGKSEGMQKEAEEAVKNYENMLSQYKQSMKNALDQNDSSDQERLKQSTQVQTALIRSGFTSNDDKLYQNIQKCISTLEQIQSNRQSYKNFIKNYVEGILSQCEDLPIKIKNLVPDIVNEEAFIKERISASLKQADQKFCDEDYIKIFIKYLLEKNGFEDDISQFICNNVNKASDLISNKDPQQELQVRANFKSQNIFPKFGKQSAKLEGLIKTKRNRKNTKEEEVEKLKSQLNDKNLTEEKTISQLESRIESLESLIDDISQEIMVMSNEIQDLSYEQIAIQAAFSAYCKLKDYFIEQLNRRKEEELKEQLTSSFISIVKHQVTHLGRLREYISVIEKNLVKSQSMNPSLFLQNQDA